MYRSNSEHSRAALLCLLKYFRATWLSFEDSERSVVLNSFPQSLIRMFSLTSSISDHFDCDDCRPLAANIQSDKKIDLKDLTLSWLWFESRFTGSRLKEFQLTKLICNFKANRFGCREVQLRANNILLSFWPTCLPTGTQLRRMRLKEGTDINCSLLGFWELLCLKQERVYSVWKGIALCS